MSDSSTSSTADPDYTRTSDVNPNFTRTSDDDPNFTRTSDGDPNYTGTSDVNPNYTGTSDVNPNYTGTSDGDEVTIKLIMLGDSAVGKSKLMERFLLDEFRPQQHSTYAVNLLQHRCRVDGRAVLVDFWDTAGQEAFSPLHALYFHRAHGALLVFDATRKATYKSLSSWYQQLRKHRPHVPVLCAVNKIDDNMDVTKRSFAFTDKNQLPLHYVSAARGTNVVRMFDQAIRAALLYKLNPTDDADFILEELDKL